jgi:type I restriction-modification system DNA methylase subunit
MTDRDSARQQIQQLVDRFSATPKRERDAFTEQQTRVSYILPLFRALGWDTESPAEMSAEEQISRGFVDFGFYLNGVPAFYLETKRVREGVSKPEYMKQAINYSYLKGVTWAVLTDFEDLMVFNAEWEDDDPEKTRYLNLNYQQYANGGFDDLWLLAKPSLLTRAIDKAAERAGRKGKREPVTSILFKQLTDWRYELFKNISGMKTTLWASDPRAVDNAVQKLIDRLIFIRSMEDRGVEEPRLKQIVRQTKKGNYFPELLTLFRELDGIYNSNLFAQTHLDFMELYDPDLLTGIINGLYKVPGSALATYDFNAIDADVLGAVYEQYLGFKAQDPTAKTKIDPRKREKRKAQGIYYTPKFVVRYIVQQTVGRRLAEGADPHNLRILDPACGSGSFLIEAFDVLDRHIAQTEKDLPAAERRQRILRENLFGVDLDDQAVEVTRLNLALRAAYGREKLPYLTNIKHGNSLIDDAVVAGATAFRWEEQFDTIMAAGGFDVVIGNPPYGYMLTQQEQEYFRTRYIHQDYQKDLYLLFLERYKDMISESGLLGVIIPNTWLQSITLKKIRIYLTREYKWLSILNFTDRVFKDAIVDTHVIVLKK